MPTTILEIDCGECSGSITIQDRHSVDLTNKGWEAIQDVVREIQRDTGECCIRRRADLICDLLFDLAVGNVGEGEVH